MRGFLGQGANALIIVEHQARVLQGLLAFVSGKRLLRSFLAPQCDRRNLRTLLEELELLEMAVEFLQVVSIVEPLLELA